MPIWKTLKTALWSLAANKLRSALTMLGIIIGVAAVITMISLGKGAQQNVTENISAMGSNLLFIRPGAASTQHVRQASAETLTLDDADAIRREVAHVVGVAAEVSRQAQVKYMNRNRNISIIGTVPEYQEVRNAPIERGRFIERRDVISRARVAAIGVDVAEDLFGARDPVGREIQVRGMNFLVVGLMKEKGATGWSNPDDQVFVPVTTAQRRLFGIEHVNNLNVKVDDERNIEPAQAEIERLLRGRHRVLAAEEADFNIRSQTEVLQRMGDMVQTFTILLGGIAGVSLLVGGIGIMNIMLVSVTERTREIGVRKAIGAKRGDILRQFLVEAIVISLVGGAIGIGLGWVGALAFRTYSEWNTRISPDSVALAFGFATAIGLFFGIWPAMKAARLNPIEALRYE